MEIKKKKRKKREEKRKQSIDNKELRMLTKREAWVLPLRPHGGEILRRNKNRFQ